MSGVQGEQCVKLRWRDTATHDGWLEFADVVENDFLVTTIGWVTHETDSPITVSPSLAACNQAHSLITTPKGCIIERHYVPAVGVQALPTGREMTPDDMLTELGKFAISALADPDRLHKFRTLLGNMRALPGMAPNLVEVPSAETRARQLFEALNELAFQSPQDKELPVLAGVSPKMVIRALATCFEVPFREREYR